MPTELRAFIRLIFIHERRWRIEQKKTKYKVAFRRNEPF